MKLQYRKCPLCKSDNFSNLYKEPVFVREREYKSKVVKCDMCNCIILNLIMTKEENDLFYNNDKQRQFVLKIIQPKDPSLDTKRRFDILDKYAHKDHKILDVGAGAGSFVSYASKKFNVRGIDVSAGRNNGIKNIFNSNIFDWKEKANIITLFQVLEHIPEPSPFLHRINQLLEDNGLLIVEVPNHNDLLLKNISFRNFYYQIAHCSYYVPDKIYNVVVNNRFSLIKVIPTQRYSLSNHLHWLIKNKPGQYKISKYIDSLYEKIITKTKYYDTILMVFRKI